MRNLFIALALMATLPRVAIGQKAPNGQTIYHFGEMDRKIPDHIDRHGRYGDSARMYMKLMLKAKSFDSAMYYNTLMSAHRHLESWRQAVYKDSAWRSELKYKTEGWKVYHSGTQSFSQLTADAVRSAMNFNRMFLNTSNRVISCPGEYVPMDADLDAGTFYSHVGNSIPALIPGAPSSPGATVVPLGGPHNAGGLYNGQLWMYGQWVPNGATGMANGSSSMVQITQDSLGNYLDPVVQCFFSGNNYGNFWNMGFVTSTGKGYVAGECESGIGGNGTWGNPWTPKPVQVTLPGGRLFKKIQGGYFILALATDGTLWSWGGGGYGYWLMQGNSPTWTTPGQITLPAGYVATDIASNGVFSEVLCTDASGNQHLMGGAQQYYDDYVGFPTGAGRLTTSIQDLSSNFYPYVEAGHKIASIAVNSNATYFLMDNGWGYGWGSTPCGELGIGLVLPWWTNGPFFWNFGPHQLQQIHPARFMPGVTNLRGYLTCLSNDFYAQAIDSNYVNYFAGRNKGGAGDVSIPQDSTTAIVNAAYNLGHISAQLPDSWNEKLWVREHINRVSKNVQVTSNFCILNPTNTTKFCTDFTNPTSKPISGNLSATVINNTVILNAYGKTCANPFIRFQWWVDTAGSASIDDMGVQTAATDTIKTAQNIALTAGVHKYHWLGITSAYDTAYDSITVVVNVGQPSVTITPANQTIYLPASSGTLACTASGANGATISSYAWTQLYGPNTAVLGSPNAASTTMTGLIQGTYEFQIKVKDSNGNTATATTFIYVQHSFNGLTVPLPTTFKHQ